MNRFNFIDRIHYYNIYLFTSLDFSGYPINENLPEMIDSLEGIELQPNQYPNGIYGGMYINISTTIVLKTGWLSLLNSFSFDPT